MNNGLLLLKHIIRIMIVSLLHKGFFDSITISIAMIRYHRDTWFQQDGATSHTARCSMDAVRRLFPTHIVSRYGDIAWPARSPDLTACDFFLWGYLKSVVFRNPPPHNTEELKERIRHEIAEIPADMLRRVMGNIQLRLEECMQRNGSHLRDIVFRK